MNRNHLAAAVIICAALTLNGCTGAGGASAGGNNANTSRQPEAAAGAAPAANTATAPQTTPAVNAAPAQVQSTPATAVSSEKAKAADVPRPQIGSGGNDFFLFTQARAALGADAELKGAAPIIEVKDGVLTLSGTVATQAQKSRAEQVARGVGGVKAVRNQLRVSAGG